MAVAASRVTVPADGSVVTLASNPASSAEGDFRAVRVIVKNLTATAAIFIGGSGLTTGNGFQWEVADGSLAWDLEPGESLSGVTPNGTAAQTVHVLTGGR